MRYRPPVVTVTVLSLGEVHLPDWHPRAGDRTCAIQAFLIRHPDGPVLVDTGVGSDHDLINEIYRPTVVPIVNALNAAGVDERDLRAIVNTHLHFDHCGQNRSLPSTPVYVQAPELAAAEAPMFTVPEWAFIHTDRKRIVHGDEEIAPGVHLIPTPGHTPGHQSILVDGQDGPELIVGQCCYTCTEYEAGQVSPSDIHDETLLEAGVESLARLRQLRAEVAYFSHDHNVHRRQAVWDATS